MRNAGVKPYCTKCHSRPTRSAFPLTVGAAALRLGDAMEATKQPQPEQHKLEEEDEFEEFEAQGERAGVGGGVINLQLQPLISLVSPMAPLIAPMVLRARSPSEPHAAGLLQPGSCSGDRNQAGQQQPCGRAESTRPLRWLPCRLGPQPGGAGQRADVGAGLGR